MDLRECFDKGLIKRTGVNTALIESLKEMADIKEKVVKTAKLDAMNISVYVSLAYDALREVLEAVCVSLGFKVISHTCIGELLKDKLEDFEFNEFDRMRYIRNGINYYGARVELEQGKIIIKKIFAMKKGLKDKCLV